MENLSEEQINLFRRAAFYACEDDIVRYIRGKDHPFDYVADSTEEERKEIRRVRYEQAKQRMREWGPEIGMEDVDGHIIGLQGRVILSDIMDRHMDESKDEILAGDTDGITCPKIKEKVLEKVLDKTFL